MPRGLRKNTRLSRLKLHARFGGPTQKVRARKALLNRALAKLGRPASAAYVRVRNAYGHGWRPH